MKLTPKSTYQSGLNTTKENENINILFIDIDAGYEKDKQVKCQPRYYHGY